MKLLLTNEVLCLRSYTKVAWGNEAQQARVELRTRTSFDTRRRMSPANAQELSRSLEMPSDKILDVRKEMRGQRELVPMQLSSLITL